MQEDGCGGEMYVPDSKYIIRIIMWSKGRVELDWKIDSLDFKSRTIL